MISLKKFDVIHVHYASSKILRLVNFIKGKSSKLIITFWGSDLLAITKDYASRIAPVVSKANYVTMASNSLEEKFAESFPAYDGGKIKRLYFGNPIIPVIDQLLDDNGSVIKRQLGLPLNKKILFIGYNGRATQHHMDIIEQLTKLNDNISKKIHIVIPLQGYDDISYVNQVKEAISRSGYEHNCFTDFKDYEDTAKLRIVSDIFVHAQNTDALSASMIEHLYTDTIIINGSWLKYEFLDEIKSQYITFDEFDDLPQIITNIIEIDIHQSPETKIAIKESLYWSYLAKKWHSLYT
jgi:hypothetical protein